MMFWQPGQCQGIDATVYTHRDRHIYQWLYSYEESTASFFSIVHTWPHFRQR
jgi:hypothetical protein